MKLATAEQMRALDRLSIEELKIPGIVLMENAGSGTARLIDQTFGDESEKGVIIICGLGNNGGDGFVIARHLHNMGYEVHIYLVGAKSKIKGDAKTNFKIVQKMGLPVWEIKSKRDVDDFGPALMNAGVVVDALFGTGLTRAIEGLFAGVIELVNENDVPVVAVDIASGLSANTGQPTGPVIAADMTATYGLGKIGQFLSPGAEISGQVEIIDISIPELCEERVWIPTHLIELDDILPLFVPRDPDTHKGTYGHVLMIGGSAGMNGAIIMAADAAVRTGAGLVTAALPESQLAIAEATLLESLKVGLPANKYGELDASAIVPLLKMVKDKDVIAIGPGLGRSEDSAAVVLGLIEQTDAPMVIDADGLNALAGRIDSFNFAEKNLVLTPHPGEMARLIGTTTEEVQKDRIGCAADLSHKTGAVVVLKGSRTVIAEPEGQIWVNPTGNPGMASGGMGDVLTGMIAGFIAQGTEPLQAAIAGVHLHGLAGDYAKADVGEHGLRAGEVLNQLPYVLKTMEEYLCPDLEEDED